MIAINVTEFRENIKNYCDKVTDNQETIFVTRKDKKNIVVLSEKEYNELEKIRRNKEYFEMIDKSMQELAEGKVVVKTMEELEEMAK